MIKKTKTLKLEKTKSSEIKPGEVKKVAVVKSSEPKNMADLLAFYDQKIYTPHLNEKVKGKVIKIEPGRLYVDISAKTEGLVAEKAYKEAENFIKTLKVGDSIDAFVIVTETKDGYTVLSLRNSVEDETWKIISDSYDNETPIKVSAKIVNPAGITVDVGTLSGFIPSSQIGRESFKNVNEMAGKSFKAVVIDFDKNARKIVLSEKEVSEAVELKAVKDAKKDINVGDMFDGIVTTVYDFGCFVKVDYKKIPIEGLVHVSEISWDKVSVPALVLKTGDQVKVKVIGKKDNKLAFSIKQTLGDPWDNVAEKYKPEMRVEGTVTRVSDYGVFVSLESGLEGLIHITKIPPDKNLSRGDKVNVNIEEVDKKNKKISLGLVLTEKPIGYK